MDKSESIEERDRDRQREEREKERAVTALKLLDFFTSIVFKNTINNVL